MAIKLDNIKVTPSGYDSTNYSYASVVSGYPLTNPVGKDSTSTSMCRVNLKTGSGAESYVFYTFDFSAIPSDATIKSVSGKAKAYISQTSSFRVRTRQVQLYYGTSTAKGSASTMSTSTTALELTCGTWTRAELDNCRLRLYAVRGWASTSSTYYMGLYGADLTVTYEWNATEYTVTATATGGSVDPTSVSLSTGDTQKFRLEGVTGKEELTSLTWNGQNVLSQAVRFDIGTVDYEVNTASGATYGFALNGNYYVSQNKAESSSAAVARVSFYLPVSATIKFYVINYAEETYDFGILGKLDTTLGITDSTDSSSLYYWIGNTSEKNINSEQLVQYDNVAAGEHYIDVKYKKDAYTDSHNDTLQFRIEIELNEPVDDGTFYYEYTCPGITGESQLVAVFGPTPERTTYIYIKENGQWKSYNAIYKKVNGVWEKQSLKTWSTIFSETGKYIKG